MYREFCKEQSKTFQAGARESRFVQFALPYGFPTKLSLVAQENDRSMR